MKPSDIAAVELVGDAVRIPILQQIVKETYGLELSKTLAPDECVARGASLYAAMNSPFFSLKDFNFEHCNSYSIIFEYPFVKNDVLEQRTTKLIQRNELFPSRKSIKFTEKQIPKDAVINVNFLYNKDEVTFMKNTLLSKHNLTLEHYMITIPQVKEEQYTLVMEFYLDQNNLFVLDKAFINEVYYEDKPATTTTPTTNTTGTTTQTPPPEGTTQPTETKPAEPEKVKKERRTNCIIKLATCTYGNSQTVLTQMVTRETNQENLDKNLKYVKDKRNELETFIYTTREYLGTSLQGFYDQKEAEDLLAIFNKTEEWMYNNVEETYVKEKIEQAYNVCTEPGNKIYRRKTHWENIDRALNEAKSSLDANIKKFENNASWLVQTEKDELQKVIENFNNQYNTTFPVCRQAPKMVEPPVDYVSIERSTKDFEDRVKKILSDADKRVKEAERKLAEEKKKLEEAAKAAQQQSQNQNPQPDQNNTGEQKMQVD